MSNDKHNRPLSNEVKRYFLEIVSTYNKYQEMMDRKSDISEVCEKLGGIVEAARELALREADDWFDKHTVKRNMSELDKLGKQFDKLAIEARNIDQRLVGLYEDMGHILSRYYKFGDITEDEMKQRLAIQESVKEKLSEGLKYSDVKVGDTFLRFGENGQLWKKISNKQSEFIKNVGKQTAKYDKKPGSLNVFPSTMDVTLYKTESVNESAMAELDILAKESKSFKDFVKDVFKEFKNLPKNRDTMKWLEGIYDDVSEAVNEAGEKIDKDKPGSVWKTWTGKYRAVAPNGWKASFKSQAAAQKFAKTGHDDEGYTTSKGLDDVRPEKYKTSNIDWGYTNEASYTNQTGVKSAIMKNTEFFNLFSNTPKIHKWINDPNVKIFFYGRFAIFTDGKREMVTTKESPFKVLKKLGKVAGETKKQYDMANESVNERADDGKIRFDVDYYNGTSDRKTSKEEIIRATNLKDAIKQATKNAWKYKLNYVELYHRDHFVGSIDFNKGGGKFRNGRGYDAYMKQNEAAHGYKDSTASYVNNHNDEYKMAEKINKSVKGDEMKFYDELEKLHDKLKHAKYMIWLSNALRGYTVDMYKDPKIKNKAEAEEALYLLSK